MPSKTRLSRKLLPLVVKFTLPMALAKDVVVVMGIAGAEQPVEVQAIIVNDGALDIDVGHEQADLVIGRRRQAIDGGVGGVGKREEVVQDEAVAGFDFGTAFGEEVGEGAE